MLLRLLTAVVLLGTALLIAALAGRSAADTRELVVPPRDAPGRGLPSARPAGVDVAQPATPGLQRARRAARETLAAPEPQPTGLAAEAAVLSEGTAPPGPDGPRPGNTVPHWAHGRREPPPAPAQRPAPDGGSGSPAPPPPGWATVVAAAAAPTLVDAGGPALTLAASRPRTRTTPQASRPAPPAPRREATPQQLQDRAAQIESRLDTLLRRMTETSWKRDRTPADSRRFDRWNAERRALADEYSEIRNVKEVPYPPKLDGLTTQELRSQADALRRELFNNLLSRSLLGPVQTLGNAKGWIDNVRREESLMQRYSDVGEALWKRLESVKAERDRLGMPGASAEEWRRRTELGDQEQALQETYDRIVDTVAYPPRLGYLPLERRGWRVVALQDAIDAVDRRRAELTGPESAENSPQAHQLDQQHRALQRELTALRRSLSSIGLIEPTHEKGTQLQQDDPPAAPDGQPAGGQSPVAEVTDRDAIRDDPSGRQDGAGDLGDGREQTLEAGPAPDAPAPGAIVAQDGTGDRGGMRDTDATDDAPTDASLPADSWTADTLTGGAWFGGSPLA
ncbi:MAG TPA: hypothetical protein VKG45_12645 [Actinomycetes bacterium]|nr:hypothetical protein [Actinomycetes bacterium]